MAEPVRTRLSRTRPKPCLASHHQDRVARARRSPRPPHPKRGATRRRAAAIPILEARRLPRPPSRQLLGDVPLPVPSDRHRPRAGCDHPLVGIGRENQQAEAALDWLLERQGRLKPAQARARSRGPIIADPIDTRRFGSEPPLLAMYDMADTGYGGVPHRLPFHPRALCGTPADRNPQRATNSIETVEKADSA